MQRIFDKTISLCFVEKKQKEINYLKFIANKYIIHLLCIKDLYK